MRHGILYLALIFFCFGSECTDLGLDLPSGSRIPASPRIAPIVAAFGGHHHDSASYGRETNRSVAWEVRGNSRVL